MQIRPEQPGDRTAIHHLNTAAFGGPAEAALVDELRAQAALHISLVAELKAEMVGHIFFSPITLTPPAPDFAAMGLAPMAVLPEYQRQGIGSALVNAGLAACRALQQDAVFVLGHPDYYPRFGFVPAHWHGFSCTYDVPPDVFMVLPLLPDALAHRSNVVHYHPAFARFE